MNKIKYSSDTPLPNNFFAEQAILNIVLTNPATLKLVTPKLKAEAFYTQSHQLIYEALLILTNGNRPVNLTTLLTTLENTGYLAKIGGIEKIINIINRFESFLDLEDHIKMVNEKYLRRLTIELGKQIIGWGYTVSTEIDQIFEKTEQSIYNLTQQKQSGKVYTSAEVVDDVFQEIKLKVKTNKTSGLLSSFKDLDLIIQGFQTSDLIIIAGRPSMGKTAFSLSLGKNIVENYGIPLVIFSLEMSRQQILYRFLAADTKINSSRLKSGKMGQEEWKILSNSLQKISELPIYIDDDPNLSILDIRSKLRRLLLDKHKSGFVIIDYLQLMKLKNNFENRNEEISYITRNLKILAKEFQIPIVALSQLSRSLESRVNKRPMLSDLRDSGCISLKERKILDSTKSWAKKNIIEAAPISFLFKGIKPTFLLEFENKITIIITSNHKILTEKGWLKVSQFHSGLAIYCILTKQEIQTKKYRYQPYKVKSIKYLGLNAVYDKTIDEYHNYITNHIVIHNSIEQDADIVIMLYREEYYKEEKSEVQLTELIVAKHRNGPTGTARVLFYPALADFKSL